MWNIHGYTVCRRYHASVSCLCTLFENISDFQRLVPRLITMAAYRRLSVGACIMVCLHTCACVCVCGCLCYHRPPEYPLESLGAADTGLWRIWNRMLPSRRGFNLLSGKRMITHEIQPDLTVFEPRQITSTLHSLSPAALGEESGASSLPLVST